MPSLKSLILLSFLSLTVLPLQGCYKTLYVDKVSHVIPDSTLLQDCPLPGLSGALVEDALEQSVKREESLLKCNIDKAALREWADRYKTKVDNTD